MENENKPNVANFEAAVAAKDYEKACSELLLILSQLDSNFGGIQEIEFEYPAQLQDLEQEKIVYFCTRMATAITTLFSDPILEISDLGVQRFLVYQRWLSLIFASSPFVNADHILQTYNREPNRKNNLEIHLDSTKAALIKFCILYLPESNVNLNLDAMWEVSPVASQKNCET